LGAPSSLARTALTREKPVLGVDLGNLMEVTSHIICPDYGFFFISRRRIPSSIKKGGSPIHQPTSPTPPRFPVSCFAPVFELLSDSERTYITLFYYNISAAIQCLVPCHFIICADGIKMYCPTVCIRQWFPSTSGDNGPSLGRTNRTIKYII